MRSRLLPRSLYCLCVLEHVRMAWESQKIPALTQGEQIALESSQGPLTQSNVGGNRRSHVGVSPLCGADTGCQSNWNGWSSPFTYGGLSTMWRRYRMPVVPGSGSSWVTCASQVRAAGCSNTRTWLSTRCFCTAPCLAKRGSALGKVHLGRYTHGKVHLGKCTQEGKPRKGKVHLGRYT